jgi:pyrroline-5-carboxylate reductase
MSIVLVGCGTMGAALKTALEKSITIHVIQPGKNGYLNSLEEVKDITSVQAILFAVKPSVLVTIYKDYKVFIEAWDPIVISLCAGAPLSFFRSVTPAARLCRAMPNLAALINKSMTGLFGDNLGEKDKQFVERLFCTAGEYVWLECEDELDAFTAICSSGIGFYCKFIESLSLAAQKQGFDTKQADFFALKTFHGVADLLKDETLTPTLLKEKVASPQGTTQAGLNALGGFLDNLLNTTIDASIKRAHELKKG